LKDIQAVVIAYGIALTAVGLFSLILPGFGGPLGAKIVVLVFGVILLVVGIKRYFK
jgi:uncharacterized membrane protein HdeD (DUF308 family)